VPFLIDTNIISEVRKGARANAGVAAWYAAAPPAEVFLSSIVVGEIRRGVELIRLRDPLQAAAFDRWLRQVRTTFGDRVLPVSTEVAELWGKLSVPDPLPRNDGWIAATALAHGLTVVTRNKRDMERTGVPVLDPFAP
jgi:hypothetical protein